MRYRALTAILATIFQVSVVPTAIPAQGIEGIVAKEAVKGLRILRWVAWKILTPFMRKESVLLFLHIDHLP